jgi:hypothetical protein
MKNILLFVFVGATLNSYSQTDQPVELLPNRIIPEPVHEVSKLSNPQSVSTHSINLGEIADQSRAEFERDNPYVKVEKDLYTPVWTKPTSEFLEDEKSNTGIIITVIICSTVLLLYITKCFFSAFKKT